MEAEPPEPEQAPRAQNALGLSREALTQMSEDELRSRVIMPLLVAMKFRDVTLWHGGANEQGKDFVMWKPDEFDQEEWHAVVAKAGRITGATSGSGSTGDVGTQVLQAFGSTFPNPVTGAPVRATYVTVIASGAILPTALTAIQSMLASSPLAAHNTRFVDGDKLWSLIEKHLPARIVTEQLSHAAKVLDGLDPRWRVESVVGGGTVSYSIEPRDVAAPGGAADGVSVNLHFPETAEGVAAQAALEHHVRTGQSVELPAEFVAVHLPEAIGALTSPDAEMVKVVLRARRLAKPLVVDLLFQTEDGRTASFTNVVFHSVHAGTTESVFETRDGEAPVAFRMRVNIKDDNGDITVMVHRCSRNVASLEHVLDLVDLMAAGVRVYASRSDSGLRLFGAAVGPVRDAAFPPGFGNLVRAAAAIQRATRTRIDLPARGIPHEEARRVMKTALLLGGEELTGTIEPVIDVLPRETALDVLEGRYSPSEGEFAMSVDMTHVVFDTPVYTTSILRPLKPPEVHGDDVDAVRSFIEEHPSSDEVPVRFTASGGAIPVAIHTVPRTVMPSDST